MKSVIRAFILFATVLAPLTVACAQTPPTSFAPDFSKPDAASFATPFSREGGVPSPVRVEKVGGALKVTAIAGGSFGVSLNVPPFDLDQLTRLSFDYTTSPDAKVNMFFRVNGNYYGVLFTGQKKVRPGTVVVYDINATKSSGHVEIPLRAAVRSMLPNDANLRVDQILVGNWDNDNYLMAGIGGNGPGASWTLSNFKIERPTVKPTFGTPRLEGGELVIPASDLDTQSFKKFTLKGELGEVPVSYDPLRSAFVYDSDTAFAKSATSPAPLRNGQNIKFQLTDDSNNVLTEGNVTFRTSELPSPPPPHFFWTEPADSYLAVDFETPEVPFAMDRRPTSTLFTRDNTNPYNGQWSACLVNPKTAHPFDLPAGASSIDVATHPVLTFAYRCDDRLRLDLILTWNNQPYSIHFVDRDNPSPRLGDLNAVTDGQWHVATFDLLSALKRAQPNATDFHINDLQWADAGWPGNAKGLKWWLDDLKWAPKTNGKLEGVVALADATGTSDVSYILDQSSSTEADEKAEGGPKLSVDLSGKTGLWWLHVRAQNGAGKWSPTAHYPLWCS